MRRRWPFLALALAAIGATPAYAEDGATPEDPMAKLRAQAEKVLKLMRENEDALLKASATGGQAPKGPDVPIPELPPTPGAGEPQGGAQGGGTQGGAAGEGAKKSMEELIRALSEQGGMIPRELEELMRMIPT